MIRVLPDPETASRAAAEAIAERASRAVRDHDRFAIALSGGSTPRRLFRLLATDYHDRLPWRSIDVYWCDERCVPPDDPRSNYHLARSTLLDHVPVSPDAIHRIQGEQGPDAAAEAYDALIADAVDRLDLALLGAGVDGHTASLFPGQLDPTDRRWARGVRAPSGIEPPQRVTLTLRALNAFAGALFLVLGPEKRGVVAAAREAESGGVGTDAPPAVHVRPRSEPLWIVDREAAGQ